MTELSFLIDLLLNDDVPKAIKELIASRIREVESKLVVGPLERAVKQTALPPPPTLQQSPSTLALMAKHGDIPNIEMPVMPAPEPVTQIAQTAATAAALQSRHDAISAAISGKIDKVAGKPRKW